MTSNAIIINEEKTFLGYKAMNDRLTLILAASTSGDCEVKPILIYQ